MAVASCSGSAGDDGTNLVTIGVSGDIDDVGDPTLGPGDPIERFEEEGQASAITYDPGTDTFTVDNLAFDGTGVYDRDDEVATLNGFRVYENNNPTERRAYKALYLESASGLSRVAVVRTGSYLGFGFGGFVYARDGEVVLPTTGQATFQGDYAGLRVFSGQGGIQYTTADAELIVDFEDFVSTRAVEGTLTNRQIFDTSGALVDTLPTLILATGDISDAGELTGNASSQRFDAGAGAFVDFEEGNYYGIIGGADADEIVGVIVVQGTDPDDATIGFQETGAFIAIETP
ncbi:hypothetical protein ACMU_06200 [Actibacterium mucosum KCTC 23349]|uniref:Transferrin-binding protein B C-lobe/N-lobe beta barrel domain-containing protein n=2 Tax=Actibacterium TaxID=1433986 RepID=A0A037ZLK9_9RHOB|nr:hypothetical protein ACMU_06200 [Actibacterium mucosum KCTC 23349]